MFDNTEMSSVLWIFIKAAVPVAVLLAFVIWRWSATAKANADVIAGANAGRQHGESLKIPLKAAFSGWKGMPWVCWSHNNAGPRLVLHPDHVECRVIQRRRKRYADVARVDYRETIGTRNVVLEFTDSIASFIGNAADRDAARRAIEHLREKGCRLSENAAALVGQVGSKTGV